MQSVDANGVSPRTRGVATLVNTPLGQEPVEPPLRPVLAAMLIIWVLAAIILSLVPRHVVSFQQADFSSFQVSAVPRHLVMLEMVVRSGWWLLMTPLVVLVVRYALDIPSRWGGLLLLASSSLLLAAVHNGLADLVRYDSAHGFAIGRAAREAGAGFSHRLPGSLFGFWVTAGVAAGLAMFRRSLARERQAAALVSQATQLEAQLARSGLAALRMQLNPHFLFNTLHMIASTTDIDPAAARDMTIQLSDLLRMTLERSDRAELTLQEELDWLDHYLEIQQRRFEERLAVNMLIAPDTRAACVPTLLLQPLVENVMKHGADPLTGVVVMELEASRRGSLLCLRLRDHGPGLSTRDNRKGIGLTNTVERLRTHYGEGARLNLRAAEGGGAEVIVELPFTLGCGTRHQVTDDGVAYD